MTLANPHSPPEDPDMEKITTPSELPLTDTRTLNARRYGLSTQQLDRFTDLLNANKAAVPSTSIANPLSGPPAGDATQGRIRDYVMQRISGRMAGSQSPAGWGGYGLEVFSTSQDMLFGPRSGAQSKSGDLSALLNMNFDLNTLQMLNGAAPTGTVAKPDKSG